MPVAFAPSAMQRLAGGEGETDTAKAAVNAGLNLTLSSQSTTSLEDVMAAAKQEAGGAVSPKLWFQIYLTPDWERNTELIKRAEGWSLRKTSMYNSTDIYKMRAMRRWFLP